MAQNFGLLCLNYELLGGSPKDRINIRISHSARSKRGIPETMVGRILIFIYPVLSTIYSIPSTIYYIPS